MWKTKKSNPYMNKITNKFKKRISFLAFLLAYLQNFIT